MATGQAGLPCGPRGPAVSCLGSLWPEWKKFPRPIFLVLEFQKLIKTCKRHIYVSVNQKNMYDIPKCSEKHALHVYVKFMHV
jgi:hypothetical protein